MVIAIVLPVSAEVALARLPERVQAEVDVYPQVTVHGLSPLLVGTNLTQHAADRARIKDPATLERVKRLGIRSVRFPNGCFADQYNWQNPQADQVTVDEFLDFCEAIGAEPYYTLNMQGGTEGLEGPAPAGAPLSERIRYRHTAPNPCGHTEYHFGTLAEAVELVRRHTIARASAGKRAITRFELGNENWGQARSDWPPDVYAATCEAYAKAILEEVGVHLEQDPSLNLLPSFTMVGFPSSGHQQNLSAAADHALNLSWTAEVNRLAESGLIDAVQEHFYTYGNNTGDSLVWTAHNLVNMLALRHGTKNPRLAGYQQEALKYAAPLELTEWNVKCWGVRPDELLALKNPGFEEGMAGWHAVGVPEGKGSAAPAPAAARRGSSGLELSTTAGADAVEVRQVFSVQDRLPAALIGAGLWVKTEHPSKLRVLLRQANEGAHKDAVLGELTASQPGTWQRLVVAGAPAPDTTACELVARLEGADARAWIDEVGVIAWKTPGGAMPLAAGRFEQQLHNFDVLRTMLEWPVQQSHYHHLFGDYPCAQLAVDGSPRDNAAAFEIYAGRIGDRLVRSDVRVAAFDHRAADRSATDFGPVAPDAHDIPALAVTATRRDDELYLVLLNRTSDRPVSTRISLRGCIVEPDAEVRTLAGADIDLPGAGVQTAMLSVSNPLLHTVPPFSGQVIRLRLAEVLEGALSVSTPELIRSVRSWSDVDPDVFQVQTSSADRTFYQVDVSADWLSVSPPVGVIAGDGPHDIRVEYETGRLAPGTYHTTITVRSPQAYNSPQSVQVVLTLRAPKADFDQDGDVDQADMARFEVCMMAAPELQRSPACAHARLDADDDVDLDDYTLLLFCFSGSDVPPGPECIE